MSIKRLKIAGIRCLKKVSVLPCKRINIIYGVNGSGKTSVLEAIHMLGLGRSFRSSKIGSVINHDSEACTVFAELNTNQTLGMNRPRKGRQQFKINQRKALSVAELATILPLQIINADTYVLVDGGPKARRQFLDWGVFHVEPSFLEHWRRTQKALRQRNSLLRQGVLREAELDVWERELAASAESVDLARKAYIDEVAPFFHQTLCRLTNMPEVELRYSRGWDESISLLESFAKNRSRELAARHTLAGPHKANIDIKVGGVPAADVLSRGQQKIMVCALKLAQGQHLAQHTEKESLYLIDDLPAELDSGHREALCKLLDEMGSQVFITGIDKNVLQSVWSKRKEVQLFHVEHGQVKPTALEIG